MMGKSLANNAALKNPKILRTITLIVQAELEDLSAKLTEKETKLKSVEEENVQLVLKLGKLQLYLETADEVREKCTEEIKRLKDELQKSIQNLEEKDNAFKTLEKHYSHVIGDYIAECMVLKKSVAERQSELDLSKEKIDTLEKRVLELEKLLEAKTTENLRFREEIEGIDRQPEVKTRSGGGKRARNISRSTNDSFGSITSSASKHVLSNSSSPPAPPPLPSPLKDREERIKLTSFPRTSVVAIKNVESFQNTVTKAVGKEHGATKKFVFENGSKRPLCKCGLSFSQLFNLNRHISRENKGNIVPSGISRTFRVRKAHKTTFDFGGSKEAGSHTLISSSPNAPSTIKKNQNHCLVNLNIDGKNGRVHCNCGKDFSTKQDLTRHISRATYERIFPCTLCGKRFCRHTVLNKHMRVVHKKKNYKRFGCGKCGKILETNNQLIIHRLENH